jgi:ketosteroid isomerase-like protein
MDIHPQKGASPIASGTTNTLIRRFFDEVVTGGDMAAAHEILTTDFVCYGPAAGVHGPVNFVQCTGMLRNALAVHFTVEVVIADGDTVSCLSTMHGTHQGDYRGSPASGRQITLPRIDTFHLVEGKIREVRTTLDHRALTQQLKP